MTINYDEISVIIQGPIDWAMSTRHLMATTKAACMNARRLLPGAEIILSTWAGQPYDGLDFDRLILSDDPGPQGRWPGFVPSNINRQIKSTVAGLKSCTRTFALKCRSDVILEGASFLKLYETLDPIAEDDRTLFRYPIVSNNLTSRNTSEILDKLPDHPLLFHPSDHIHFGRRTDLLSLWDAPPQSDEDAFFFLDRAQPNRWRYHELGRLTPEQYLMTSAISKKMQLNFSHYGDSSPFLLALSEYYLESHFVFLPDRSFPIYFPKYHTPHHFSFEWMRRNPDQSLLGKTEEQLTPRPRISLGRRLTFPFRRPKLFSQRIARRLGLK